MESIYQSSVSAIEILQTRFENQRDLMIFISKVGDPRYAFTFYFPLLFALDWAVGQRLLLVAVVAEWLNQILKWILYGDRPYWWIHETNIYNSTSIPNLQQYHVTCETGPGCPSGHAMVMSSLWFIMISAFVKNIDRNSFLSKSSKILIEHFLWWCYIIFILAINVSRVYLATHFPHQCLAGVIIGLCVAYQMNKMNFEELQLKHYLLMTSCIVTTALGTYWLLAFAGADPLWSIQRAVKWCIKKEYIHIDTTPFFSMVRYCGAILGLGLGITSQLKEKAAPNKFTISMRLEAIALSVIIARSLDLAITALPKENLFTFYASALLLNVLLPFLVTAVVPFTVVKLSGGKAVDAKHKES